MPNMSSRGAGVVACSLLLLQFAVFFQVTTILYTHLCVIAVQTDKGHEKWRNAGASHTELFVSKSS